MFKLEVEFSDELIQSIISEMAHWYHVELTENQIRDLFLKDEEIALRVRYWGMDTDTRERLIDAILEQVGMEPWPINGDSEQKTQEFFKEWREKASLSGFKLLA